MLFASDSNESGMNSIKDNKNNDRVGLKYLRAPIIPARGYTRFCHIGTVLGDVFYVGEKPSGVEPGFLAFEIDQEFINRVNQDAVLQRVIKQQFSDKDKLKYYLQSHIHDPIIQAALFIFGSKLREQSMGKFPNLPGKKLKLWLFKQHYLDPYIKGIGVAPSSENLSRTNAIKNMPMGFKTIGTALYYLGRLNDPSDESTNAILECFANAVAHGYGLNTQEQYIHLSVYLDGTPKMLTRCLWDEELESLEGFIKGSKDRKQYENYYVRVQRDNNGKIIKKNKQLIFEKNSQGLYIADDSIEDLAESFALFITQGDVDALGSVVQNKGRKGNELYGYDFGHAYRGLNFILETLQDDFSFSQPVDTKEKFKNFSMFSDATLREHMRGLLRLYRFTDEKILQQIFTNEERDRIETVIEEYLAADPKFAARYYRTQKGHLGKIADSYMIEFTQLANDSSPEQRHEYEKYIQAIHAAHHKAVAAHEKILTLFKQRLLLNPAEIDLLDNLEKLTSATSFVSTDGTVELHHLRVLPGERIAWQVQKSCDQFTLRAQVPADKLEKVYKQLKLFLKLHHPELELNNLLVIAGEQIQIQVSTKYLPILMSTFEAMKVKNFKRKCEQTLSALQGITLGCGEIEPMLQSLQRYVFGNSIPFSDKLYSTAYIKLQKEIKLSMDQIVIGRKGKDAKEILSILYQLQEKYYTQPYQSRTLSAIISNTIQQLEDNILYKLEHRNDTINENDFVIVPTRNVF